MSIDFSQPFTEFVRAQDLLVSVVVPSYNKAQFLTESVSSALSQTYANLEIIIVNDGSTDATPQVAQELIAKNPSRRIVYLDKPNGGISDARNFAIARASGRIIMCLDGDDIALPTFIERGLERMRTEGANLVCCDVELFGAQAGDWVPPDYDAYGQRFNNSIPTLVMYDRLLWTKTGGYKTAFAFVEDWEFFVNASNHDLRVGRIREKLFRYRVTESGLAQVFIKDTWSWSCSLVATSNSNLYAVEDLLWAHEQLKNMKANWPDKFQAQLERYPNEWLLHFWLGLFELGRTNVAAAYKNLARSAEISAFKEWQPMYKLAEVLEAHKAFEQAMLFYHQVRTLRPDMNKLVKDKIQSLSDLLRPKN